jgi:hypothetical protein
MTPAAAAASVRSMRLHALARAATRRPETTIALWLGSVVACSAAGAITGTRTIGLRRAPWRVRRASAPAWDHRPVMSDAR